jgi:uncharacterized RDD family membrane protein YckC
MARRPQPRRPKHGVISNVEPVLKIPSVTGVDLELRIAGPGGRSYAFIIDWHIRLLAALAYVFSATLIYARPFGGSPAAPGQTDYFFVVAAPALAIYFLYHPVLEVAMKGRTPGKRIAGVRLVKRDGGIPGIGALLIRNVFRLVDSLPTVYVVGLTATMLTREAVRVGDIAAGTVLVYDEATDAGDAEILPARAVKRLGLQQAEIVRDLLGRWDELAPATRSELARHLIARLGRNPPDTSEALRAELESLLS